MRIFHNKGKNNVTLELNAKRLMPEVNDETGEPLKQNSKIGQMLGYDKREMKSILTRFSRKKQEVRSVIIRYTWGYKTKEPGIYYSWHKYPLDARFSLERLLNYASVDMEEKYGNYIMLGSDETVQPGETKPRSYYLREVDFMFIPKDKEK